MLGYLLRTSQMCVKQKKTESELSVSLLAVMETSGLDYSWYVGSLEGSLSEDLSYGNPQRDFK